MDDITGANTIQSHNEKAAAMWSSGGRAYDEISRGIADGIEHAVTRLSPKPGERVLDIATGTVGHRAGSQQLAPQSLASISPKIFSGPPAT